MFDFFDPLRNLVSRLSIYLPPPENEGFQLTYEVTPTAMIALGALGLSVLNFGWTLHRDLKGPKLRVDVQVRQLYGAGGPVGARFLEVRTTNLGPTANKTSMPQVWKSWWRRKTIRSSSPAAIIMPDYAHAASSSKEELVGLLEVGDSVQVILPYNADCFLKEREFVSVGVVDVFGNRHTMRKVDLKKLRAQFDADFR